MQLFDDHFMCRTKEGKAMFGNAQNKVQENFLFKEESKEEFSCMEVCHFCMQLVK